MSVPARPLWRPIRGELGYVANALKLSRRNHIRDEISSLSQQVRAIMRRSGSSFPETDRKVLFVTGFGLSPTMLAYEAVLVGALHVRGAKIAALYCNQQLPACEFNFTGNNRPDAGVYRAGITRGAVLRACDQCVSNIRAIHPHLPLTSHDYREFQRPEDHDVARELSRSPSVERLRELDFEGIALGEEVFSSVLRVTLRGTIDDSPSSRWLVSRYLHAGVLMVRAARRAFEKLSPDRAAMVHGVYLTHGLASKVANQLGIPTVIYGTPYRKNTIWLSHRETYHRSLMSESTSVWQNHELSDRQRNELWSYLTSRQSGNRDHVSYHPNPIEDSETLLREVCIDRSRKIVSLFTNVIWDAQIYYGQNAFQNIFDWLRVSIEALGNDPKVWLVVRIHPAEVKGGLPTRQPMLPELQRMFPKLPENVRIIPPESDLSSYTLGENSQASLIYGTKMGVELAARGIPVIVAGEAMSRGKGFTIDVSSEAEYRKILEGISEIPRLDQRQRVLAERYAYYFFFRKMIDFPFVSVDNVQQSLNVRLNFDSLEDLRPGVDAALDVIANGILSGTPLHLGPDEKSRPGQ